MSGRGSRRAFGELGVGRLGGLGGEPFLVRLECGGLGPALALGAVSRRIRTGVPAARPVSGHTRVALSFSVGKIFSIVVALT
ncbi:hypothetical protein ACFQ0M_21690 [Kitasatospora aburaviensis]